MESTRSYSVATFGGGCFWCLEPLFAELKGVNSVVVGYAGGRTKDPTYEDVCYRNTGHAEVVQVTFDPAEVSYRNLLEVFFSVHNPTTPNRQGADVGKCIVGQPVIQAALARRGILPEHVAKGEAGQRAPCRLRHSD